jgi:hypothetical protein
MYTAESIMRGPSDSVPATSKIQIRSRAALTPLSFQESAVRETREETGLCLDDATQYVSTGRGRAGAQDKGHTHEHAWSRFKALGKLMERVISRGWPRGRKLHLACFGMSIMGTRYCVCSARRAPSRARNDTTRTCSVRPDGGGDAGGRPGAQGDCRVSLGAAAVLWHAPAGPAPSGSPPLEDSARKHKAAFPSSGPRYAKWPRGPRPA